MAKNKPSAKGQRTRTIANKLKAREKHMEQNPKDAQFIKNMKSLKRWTEAVPRGIK